MKIAFLGPAPPLRGGISQFALSLASVYLEDGHQVKMFGFKRQYPSLIFPGKSQTSEFELPSSLSIENELVPYRPDTWPSALSKIRKFEPELLIVSYFIPFFAPAYIMICRALKNKVRIVGLLHNLIPHEPWLGAQMLAKTWLDSCDQVVCLSAATSSELRSLMPNRIVIKSRQGFHPVYDHYLRTGEASREREPHTLLFFGLIKKYKGLDILLKAMPQILVELPDARLLIAGEIYGKDEEYLGLIQDLGIGASVEANFSFIPDHEVAGYFQRSSLCVIPYRNASQSGVIALSYAFGLPVLASRLQGLMEYIDEGSTGLLIDADPEPDPQALAEAVIRYLKQGRYEDMNKLVKPKADDYSWPKLAELILR